MNEAIRRLIYRWQMPSTAEKTALISLVASLISYLIAKRTKE